MGDDDEDDTASSCGAENLSDNDRGSIDSTNTTKTRLAGPTCTDFKTMKADRISRIAARTSALNRAEEGAPAANPPLGETINASNKSRSKIPTVRRITRQTRGAV